MYCRVCGGDARVLARVCGGDARLDTHMCVCVVGMLTCWCVCVVGTFACWRVCVWWVCSRAGVCVYGGTFACWHVSVCVCVCVCVRQCGGTLACWPGRGVAGGGKAQPVNLREAGGGVDLRRGWKWERNPESLLHGSPGWIPRLGRPSLPRCPPSAGPSASSGAHPHLCPLQLPLHLLEGGQIPSTH